MIDHVDEQHDSDECFDDIVPDGLGGLCSDDVKVKKGIIHCFCSFFHLFFVLTNLHKNLVHD